jgi:hypothetical protein
VSWKSKQLEEPPFNLPERLRWSIPRVAERELVEVMHNDTVVHGLSEVAFMKDASLWGIFTVGTGLDNTLFKSF